MQINIASQGKYATIKVLLFGAMTMFIGPAVMSAVMNAMSEGDITRYLMAIGLLMVGVVLILIYVFLSHEEQEEAPKKAVKKAVVEESKDDPPVPVKKDEPVKADAPVKKDGPVEKAKDEEE
jgi:uncharacterized membrane protein (DUF485 family)